MGQFRVKADERCIEDSDALSRFRGLCHPLFAMNVTEAKHFYGSQEQDTNRIFKNEQCINPPECQEYVYRPLNLNFLSYEGQFAEETNYGSDGYFLDFDNNNKKS